jgi:predicted SprT family Zn-dependent metalloprotease|tara:strand:- start:83 stop:589 length:507 start_codon:yes stop_codon:yes gene_type:complete
MDKGYASYLAIFNLSKHGLLQHGWKFNWHKKKIALGTCSYNRKKIYLAEWYVELNDKDEVMDTILHEIAHALAYHRHGSAGRGHGRIWKSVCREIGAKPERCSKDKLNKPKTHYKYVDKCCGTEYKKHRLRNNIIYTCPKCGVSLFKGEKAKMADRSAKELLDSIFSS